MPSRLIVPFTALALALPALAQTAPGDSRIARVTVYPGSATVERVARVSAGTRSLSFDCLPASLDVQSLQVSANAAVRIGETSVLAQPRAAAGRCAAHPLDARIRELEAQKDALQAQDEALALVTNYLNDLASGGGKEGKEGREAAPRPAVPDPKALAGMADALRRTGEDALLRHRQLARREADLDRELEPLLAERKRAQGTAGKVVSVTVTLAATADADVSLSYQVAGPSWSPSYRALLDSATRKLRIERQALVAQSTGEDWRGVKLLLSTGQPRRETAARLPAPWRIGVAVPVERRREEAGSSRHNLVSAPAPMAALRKGAAVEADAEPDGVEGVAEPVFEVAVLDGSYATQFSVPQAVDVPSSGRRVTMTIGQHEDSATLFARTSPQLEAAAFVVAELPVPPGVWPAGPMQLYRDGAYVGNGRWDSTAESPLALSFGRDERVRVTVEPGRDSLGSGGFAGNRSERTLGRAYTVENRHPAPLRVQVLEAAPVSVDEQVRVAVKFAPQPAEAAWKGQPGLAMWQLELAPGATARVGADYLISHPKDVVLQDR